MIVGRSIGHGAKLKKGCLSADGANCNGAKGLQRSSVIEIDADSVL